jgi:hypothetical protein
MPVAGGAAASMTRNPRQRQPRTRLGLDYALRLPVAAQAACVNGMRRGLDRAVSCFLVNHLGNVVKVQQPSVRQLIPIGGTAYRQAVLTNSPLVYWRVDESSGTIAADSSGNGNAGAYTGAYVLGEPGAIAGSTDTAVRFTAGQLTASLASLTEPGWTLEC